jgi:hypothetical protein
MVFERMKYTQELQIMDRVIRETLEMSKLPVTKSKNELLPELSDLQIQKMDLDNLYKGVVII